MKFVLVVIFSLSIVFVRAQTPCSGEGRTPETAISICGQLTFTQPDVTSCTGFPLPATGCTTTAYTSNNSVWYKFHCFTAGNLGFIITPSTTNEDFDWILLDVTGRPLSDVFTTNLYVAYNLSGVRGQTGATATGTGLTNCASGVPFCTRPALLAGHDYLLMVNNFQNTQHGYTLQFTNSSAGLFDDSPPIISGASVNGCNPSQIKLAFDKNIICSSLTASGSEFSIPGATITGVSSYCSSGYNSIRDVVLNLQSPLAAGAYTVQVNTGSDGNTLTDVCGNVMAAGVSSSFNVSPPQSLQLTRVTYSPCNPRKLTVVFSKKILCGSVSTTANEFQISGMPGNIVSMANNCSNTMTAYDTLELNMLQPLAGGNYTLAVVNGSDGNTVVDSCNNAVNAGAVISFVAASAPPPVFDSVTVSQCSPDKVTAWFSHPIDCSSISFTGDQFSISGPSVVNIIGVIAPPTGCQNSRSVTLRLAQPIDVAGVYTLRAKAGASGATVADTCAAHILVGASSTFNALVKPSADFVLDIKRGCDADTAVASHNGTGIVGYQWLFGDGTQGNAASITKIFTNGAASSTLQLIVSNGFCTDTITKQVALDHAFTNSFTTSIDSTCINTDIMFANGSQGSNIIYQWSFGDNSFFTGYQPPAHQYTQPGEYTVTLTAVNNIGCTKVSSKKVYASSVPIISVAGIADEYCAGKAIGLTANIQGPATSYRWETSTGAVYQNVKTLNFTYRTPGSYTIKFIASNRFCGESQYTKDVVINPSPYVNLGYDITLCPDSVTTIGVAPQAGYIYLWSTGQNTSKITTAPFSANYTLTASLGSCTASDEVFVRVMSNCLIKIPGAFTPNGDGLNDILKAINADLAKDFSLKIYNRYGSLMFETTNPLIGWDGRYQHQPADAGTYVWQLSFVDPLSHKKVFDKGTVLLIK